MQGSAAIEQLRKEADEFAAAAGGLSDEMQKLVDAREEKRMLLQKLEAQVC